MCEEAAKRAPRLELRLARERLAPCRARRAIEGVLDGVPAPLLADVLLLTSELVANSVRHGAGEQIRLRAVLHTDRVLVEVWDGGSGFSAVAPRLPEPTQHGGRGLYLVDMVATSWGIHRVDDAAWVWFEIKRR